MIAAPLRVLVPHVEVRITASTPSAAKVRSTVKPWSALAYTKLHEKGIEPELRPLSLISKDIVDSVFRELLQFWDERRT